ncbi:MAG TPA: YIP1 family protein [Candidatus Scalindua sp.]|nr:YIP1 family protein [Candidatus Scalindua sp.]
MSGSLINRTIRAAKLDAHLYEEVEADRSAMRQAMIVVILSGIAAGVGSISQGGALGVAMGTVMGLVGWYIWAFIIYFIGTKFLPEPQTKSNVGELLRTIGFASAPGLIRVFGVFPGVEKLVFPVATVWMLVAMVIAVKQALDYKGMVRAVIVCLIGLFVQIAILLTIFSFFKVLPKPA